MDGEEGCSGFGRGVDRASDGVGDVVELEVEEDVEPAVAELPHDAVADSVVELHADFVPLAGLAEMVYELHGCAFVGEVQCYGEAVFCRGHGFSLTVLRGLEVFVFRETGERTRGCSRVFVPPETFPRRQKPL
jgi:hypothetical protein